MDLDNYEGAIRAIVATFDEIAGAPALSRAREHDDAIDPGWWCGLAQSGWVIPALSDATLGASLHPARTHASGEEPTA